MSKIEKKKTKTIDVNIVSISPLIQQQDRIILSKLLSKNEQQQQQTNLPPQNKRNQQKQSYSQLSNQINFSHSNLPLNTQNSNKQNCICTKHTKTHQVYEKKISQFLQALDEYLNQMIDVLSGKTKGEEQNISQSNLKNTNTFLFPQNNNTSLYPNKHNLYKSHLSTNAKKKHTKQTCHCAKSQKIKLVYKTYLINIWKSLQTLILILADLSI